MIDEIQSQLPQSSHADVDAIFRSPSGSPSLSPSKEAEITAGEDGRSPQLENMMDGLGQMGSVDRQNPKKQAFYGGSSGFAFLQKTQGLFSGNERNPVGSSDLSNTAEDAITRVFDSPLPDRPALDTDVPMSQLLPHRRTATKLVKVVFNQAYPLLQLVDQESFQTQTDRIYDLDPIDFEDSDHDFLPLFYAVVAIGFLFSQTVHKEYGCRRALSQAMRHFIAAQQLIDITRCRDLVSLQVLICLAIFLMSTARIATAHTYIALAVSTAMKLGLHSAAPSKLMSFSELEQNMRGRVFWTIVQMDMYMSSVLGLPALVNRYKLDNWKPRVAKEEIDSLRDSQDPGQNTILAASAKHHELLSIISNANDVLYPRSADGLSKGRKPGTILVKSTRIKEIEHEYRQWRKSVPKALSPDTERYSNVR